MWRYHPGMLIRFIKLTFVLLLGIVFLGYSTIPPVAQMEQIRAHTRNIEFDYLGWALNAMGLKISQLALGTIYYYPQEQHQAFKLEYLDLLRSIASLEAQIRNIYSDPDVADPLEVSAEYREQVNELYIQRDHMAPLAEAIIQRQVAAIATEHGLTVAGQPIPPVLYRTTPLPLALIISQRDVIQQIGDVSLVPGIPVDEQAALEERVDSSNNVSSLIVPIGGVGLYPTMVMQTTDINWLAEVVAHEWIHNYLTLRPLGVNYFTTPELRTMNETVATIAGKEISYALVAKYYPEHLPPPPPPDEGPRPVPPTTPPDPSAFDFRAEMRETRVTVDELLLEGKIEEAEAYMEERRRFFWDNGYRLRKLNQAYFAFYGAYADLPGGAAGDDPVGEAVRMLRENSPNLADFINRMSWMYSYEHLQAAVEEFQN
jgi:hypothetical protein